MTGSDQLHVEIESVTIDVQPTTVDRREETTDVVVPSVTQERNSNSEIPSPVPLDHEESILDECRSEERLPVSGVDPSKVMVYPPLNSKTSMSQGFSQEFSIPEAPPSFSGQQLPPSGWQQPFPPVWSHLPPAGYGYLPPGYQYPLQGYQPAPMLQAPPPGWQYPPGYVHQYGAPVPQPVPAVKSSPIVNVPVQHQQVHTVVTTRSKSQKTRRSGSAPVTQQSQNKDPREGELQVPQKV